jgi:hypothetical protein
LFVDSGFALSVRRDNCGAQLPAAGCIAAQHNSEPRIAHDHHYVQRRSSSPSRPTDFDLTIAAIEPADFRERFEEGGNANLVVRIGLGVCN